ncbi:MAG: hypothetical protein IT298_16730 [Chloroflexi bacterium]|jgi:hypothetical protein|nr:hypothetical protein [Chloroflexota bacterium]MBV6436310.1 hypothetical protein [Anaerolineae bacterium]MDL1914817.1 hypothetical protein [Anaerolineae bacterium CFX4]OQY86049.1 MAG: hypothetical protein B6D42_02115 [Anaerolineae bacterium UTCFX5]MCC6567405.1 hypothetical protein [Chloroflexota bacterium]
MTDAADSIKAIAETENYLAYSVVEPDGEETFHLELGSVTLHFFREEWEELLGLMDGAIAAGSKGKR